MGKILLGLAGLAACIAAVSPVHAQSDENWVDIGKDAVGVSRWVSPHAQTEIDPKSGVTKIWAKFQPPAGTQAFKYAVVLWEIDCRNDRHRVLQASTYDFKNKPSGVEPDFHWEYNVPGTTGATLTKMVCSPR